MPELGDLSTQAAILVEQANLGRASQQARAAAVDRYREFLRLRDDALVHDVHFTGLDLAEDLESTRASARAALGVFAPPGSGEAQGPGPLPSSLTRGEREEIVAGSYELLLILAEAVAHPRPLEDPARQANLALRILDRAAELHPMPTPAYHLRRAACLARKRDAVGAELERAKAGRLKPGGAADLFLIGHEHYKRGLLAEAQHDFDAALRLRPDHFWALYLSAVCDLRLRPPNPKVAAAKLRECVARHSDFPSLYLLRGYASSQSKGDDEDAEADYEKALKLGPSKETRYAILVNRGVARSRPGQGRLKDAVADLEEAIRLDPARYPAHVTLAHLQWQRGQRSEALDRLGQAIARAPDMAALYRTRALWRLERLERPAALADLEAALRRESATTPPAVKDQALRGHLLYLEGRYEDALKACDDALAVDPGQTEALRWRVAALLELKRYGDVLVACDRYLAKGPPSAELFEVRGLAREHRNDFAGAIDDYTHALALQPDRAPLYIHRGWAHLVSEAPRLALRDFDEAARLDPADADAYSGRGCALVLIGRYEPAVADADKALRLGAPTPRRLYNAARTYAQAAAVMAVQTGRRGGASLDVAFRYQDRALDLLEQSLTRLPAAGRPAFWRDVVRSDDALRALRRRPRFNDLATRCAPSAPLEP
jgi:tetratricopeptide (TPR) repeat protein